MANTITNTRLVLGNSKVVQYLTIASDGTQETDLVVYDSSVVAGLLGKTDPLNSKIRSMTYVTSGAAVVAKLEWDATTDVLALALPKSDDHMCFDHIGGLKNTAGTGKTGDILLTTTGLAAGDSLTLILVVGPEL